MIKNWWLGEFVKTIIIKVLEGADVQCSVDETSRSYRPAVRGYKRIPADKYCYCPSVHSVDSKGLVLYEYGIHFCKKIEDCLKFPYNEKDHYVEVIGYGDMQEDSVCCCCDNIIYLRELSSKEIYEILLEEKKQKEENKKNV